MIIPNQLNSCSFVRIKSKSKAAYETEWQLNPYTKDTIFDGHNGNYGVIGGYDDIIIIDADHSISLEIAKKLPATFTIKTPKQGYHFYYRCPDFVKKVLYAPDDDNTHIGEIQGAGTYVVAPGSTYPDGKGRDGVKYTIADNRDIPIADITANELNDSFGMYYRKDKAVYTYQSQNTTTDCPDIALIAQNIPLKEHGSELCGPHPIHGSKGGENFWINKSKNMWHCFRCDTGGDSWTLIALLEGIVSCDECSAGSKPLSGDKFTKTLEHCEKYGVEKPVSNKPSTPSSQADKKTSSSYKIVDTNTIMGMTENPRPWMIDKIIPENAITALNAASGEGKSIVAMFMADAIANGTPLFGELDAKTTKVLYIDQEMDGDTIISRVKSILPPDRKPFGYMYKQFWNIMEDKEFDWLKEQITVHGYKCIFLDTFSNIHGREENSSKEMRDVNLRLLDLTYLGCTIIYLHHNRKKQQGEKVGQNSARGSGELVAKLSSLLMLSTNRSKDENGNLVLDMTLKQEKSRRADSIGTIALKIMYDTKLKKTTYEYLGETTDGDVKQIAKQAVLDYLNAHSDGVEREMLITETAIEGVPGRGRNLIGTSIVALVKAEVILMEKDGRKNVYYPRKEELTSNNEIVYKDDEINPEDINF